MLGILFVSPFDLLCRLNQCTSKRRTVTVFMRESLLLWLCLELFSLAEQK